jgi:pimeloyl-ACP methyl ester carboxylesterase
VDRPKTRYARSGDCHIAYQEFGSGDLDLVLVSGFVSHIELLWEGEHSARFPEGLGSFARVLNFDRRGTGLSDPVTEAPTLEQRMDDVRAVMDAAGSERAALLGLSEGATMSRPAYGRVRADRRRHRGDRRPHAARICSLADVDEVLVSRTVRDLVAGSGIELADRGRHELKGVPGEWDTFAVCD